jgi:uncharacterized protein
MRLVTYAAAEAFLSDVQTDLEVCEAENSLLLGLALGLAALPPSQPFLAAAYEGELLLLAALMTPPYPLVLYARTDAPDTAYTKLVGGLADRPVSGVISARDAAERFSFAWCAASEVAVRATLFQRIYELEVVEDPGYSASGMLRGATAADIELVSRWFVEFTNEALNDQQADRARGLARTRVEQGQIFLWDADGPKCMVGSSRATRHTISVNAVYTPPEYRRQGLASSAVAELCRRLLGRGFQRCVLYTDRSNPTSNSIYLNIGFNPVSDSLHVQFQRARPGS